MIWLVRAVVAFVAVGLIQAWAYMVYTVCRFIKALSKAL